MHRAAARPLRTAAALGSSRHVCRRTIATSPSGFQLTEDQLAIQALARDFTAKEITPKAQEHDRTMAYPTEIIRKAWDAGLLNGHIPEAYGGPELSIHTLAVISEELAFGCTGMQTAMEANGLAQAPLIVAASDALKSKYLARMTEEPLMAAYAVTEAGGGSDVAAARTTATKDGDNYVLNGTKMWITNSGHANWFFVLARTGDKEAKPHRALTGFVVDGDSPGLSVGSKLVNMGQRCSDTREVIFDNVVVPKENVIGAEGQGFKVAMKAFDITRPLVAAGAVGLAQRALDEALRYAQERKTFGKPIIEHQAIAFMLAEMAIGAESSRAAVWQAARAKDADDPSATYFASIAKALASHHAVSNANMAVQVHGGFGFNDEYVVSKLYRDAKIFEIYEGTSQIQKLVISRYLASS